MKLALKRESHSRPRPAVAPAPHPASTPYSSFDQIDGRHPWQKAVPNGFVPYRVRILRKSRVVFFNFPLAKEMGLIPADHPERLTKKLIKKIIETFALRVINEYDIAHNIKYPEADIKTHPYMATRYLQLQHNCRRGTTSGDGRSIWNGSFSNGKQAWDISSCGTGATRLSPGAVESKKPIKTGDKKICYGNGLADIDEGLSAALLSEIFHHKNLATERTLLILETPEKSAINVRVAPSLLRPSHLFTLLRQRDYDSLKAGFDLFLDRQLANGAISALPHGSLRYETALRILARDYARFTAQLEHEYIFCWLAWDGDNMLLNGGIIDYGSIRKFGLFHHRYRYDDVDRFSTTITEQKREARFLIRTLAQLTDYLKTQKKKSHRLFHKHTAVQLFDREFVREKDRLLLLDLGFSEAQVEKLLHHPAALKRFKRSYQFFERALAPGGLKEVADGINQAALFNARGIIEQLPRSQMQGARTIPEQEFFQWVATPLAEKKANLPSAQFARHAQLIQAAYRELAVAVSGAKSERRIFLELGMRASLRIRPPQITGDGAIHIVDLLLSARRRLKRLDFQHLFFQLMREFTGKPYPCKKLSPTATRYLNRVLKIAADNKFSL